VSYGDECVKLWVGWVLRGFCRHGSSLPCGGCGEFERRTSSIGLVAE
jgi:hypothetical protein